MSDLLLVWCFSTVTAASTVATCWAVRKLHTSRHPDRVDMCFVVVAVNVLCALLAFKTMEGLLR